jgi:hypothetical protein
MGPEGHIALQQGYWSREPHRAQEVDGGSRRQPAVSAAQIAPALGSDLFFVAVVCGATAERLGACRLGGEQQSRCPVFDRRDAPEVAVCEAVTVAFEDEDLGVADEPVDHPPSRPTFIFARSLQNPARVCATGRIRVGRILTVGVGQKYDRCRQSTSAPPSHRIPTVRSIRQPRAF